MNQDQAEGKMTQITGRVKEMWGRLTDDEVALYNGKREQFLGVLQERYGLVRHEAQKQLDEFDRRHQRAGSDRKSSDRAA